MHKIFVLQEVYFMPLHVSSTCAHQQEVKIVLYSLWYLHTYRCEDTEMHGQQNIKIFKSKGKFHPMAGHESPQWV